MPEATSSTLTSTSMPTTIQRCQAHLHGMRDEFGVKLWDVQGRPVGPHPDWSCRLAFGPQKLSDAVGWLALKACLVGLVVLVDPQTGDAVKDLVGGDRASGSVSAAKGLSIAAGLIAAAHTTSEPEAARLSRRLRLLASSARRSTIRPTAKKGFSWWSAITAAASTIEGGISAALSRSPPIGPCDRAWRDGQAARGAAASS